MKVKQIFLTLLLFTALFLSGPYLWAQDQAELSPEKQRLYDLGFGVFSQTVEAPDFSIQLLDGSQVSLSDYRGKLVLLNLWATWCPPCRAEMPSMQELYDKLHPKGFEILAVAAPNPPRETLDKIRDFVSSNAFSFPILIDEQFEANSIYGTGSIPTSYIISTDGELVARLTGAIDWKGEDIVKIFTEMLP